MDPEQARTEYFDVFNKIQALAPGDWTKVTPEAPGDVCHLPLGMEGTKFSFDSMHGGVVQTQPSGASRDQTTTGFGDGKFSTQLGTSSLGTTLGGNTRCAPDPEGKFR
ncbi:hypothetical protein [Arthrobacter sp. D5-1]|uniref:hypothetical protein n=1 Tax=Arthrobacter sp. D5-1 TaxID=1477518 RepID=UPI001A998E5D|nr:hypothetical protein [Arthrobacter sp. D5-1]QSZ47636.1 hypothetical protein AYX22_03860 [Arthrobacter sp. D5-1]